jgi:hypothetical protein
MQVRRDSHPLQQPCMHMYAVSYMAHDRYGQWALGATYVASTDQERAEAFAWDYAFQSLPEAQGYQGHFTSVCLIDAQKIRNTVRTWE